VTTADTPICGPAGDRREHRRLLSKMGRGRAGAAIEAPAPRAQWVPPKPAKRGAPRQLSSRVGPQQGRRHAVGRRGDPASRSSSSGGTRQVIRRHYQDRPMREQALYAGLSGLATRRRTPRSPDHRRGRAFPQGVVDSGGPAPFTGPRRSHRDRAIQERSWVNVTTRTRCARH
jgi:hypothetical protein